MTTKDELIDWLRDAYAMEKAMLITLGKQIDSEDTLPPLRAELKVHRVQTQRHARLMEECLHKLGGDVSMLKTTFAETIEGMKSMGASFARDAGVKTMLAAHAAEHFEIGCYIALAAGARNLGMTDIAMICEEVLTEERHMAAWLEQNLQHAVTSYLRKNSGDTPRQPIARENPSIHSAVRDGSATGVPNVRFTGDAEHARMEAATLANAQSHMPVSIR